MRTFPPAMIFAVLTALIFAVVFLVVPLRLTTNDDTFMMMIASGQYNGEPSSYLVFINYYMGVLLSTLYSVLPGFDWYPVFMLFFLSACGAMALVTAGVRLSEKTTVSLAALIAFGAVLLCCTIQMQFTTVAAICTATGSWATLSAPTRSLRVAGAALVIVGFLYRFEAAALALAASGPLFLLGLWRKQAPFSRYVALGAVVCICLGLHVSGDRAYRAVDADYDKFNEIRGSLNDNPYNALPPESLPDGISPNDYDFLLHFFADPQEITLADLVALEAEVSKNERSLTAADWMSSALEVLERRPVQLTLVSLLLLALLIRPWPQALLVFAGAFCFAFPLIFVASFDYLKERVLFSAVASVCASLFFLNLYGNKPRWLSLAAQLPLLALVAVFLMTGKDRLVNNLAMRQLIQDQTAFIQNWDGPVYAYAQYFQVNYARLFTSDVDDFSGRIVWASWMVNHPSNDAYKGHADLLQENAALFLRPDRQPELIIDGILEALAENYQVAAQAEIVAESPSGMLVTFRPRT